MPADHEKNLDEIPLIQTTPCLLLWFGFVKI